MARRGSQSGMAEAFMHPSVGRNRKLEEFSARLDWSELERVLGGLRSGRRGAPPFAALLMFKALLLQQWYGLSDPGLEEALCDRMSFRRFVGLNADEAGPDHTTLWRFREALSQQGLDGAAFEAVNRQLDDLGLIVRQGTLIDASLVAAASRPPAPPKPDELAPGASKLVGLAREPQADWTKRGRARWFGYKAHVGVDKGSGIIRRVFMSGAACNDTEMAEALVVGDEAEVWADKAYDSHARRAALKARRVKNRIMRRGNKHHPESRWSVRRNRLIGRVRGRAETVFAVLKRHYGKARARYLTLARNQADLILACTAMNLRRALVLTA
jgi:transposase, IS5 family